MRTTTSALAFCLLTTFAFGQAIRVSPEVASQMSQPASSQGTVSALQPSTPSTQSPPAKGTASIEGAVVSTEGDRPVRKAMVTLIPMIPVVNPMQAQDNRQTFQTEADGHFVFKDLPAGQYNLMVQHPNYVGTGRQARMITQQVKLADAQTLKDVTFRLVPAAIIRGKITDEDGDPVTRAQVAVMRQQYVRGKKQLQQAGSGNSDDLGEYRVSGLPPGSYWVSASRPMMMGMASGADAKNPMQYVRTFYPGATDMQGASPVEVKPGDEVPVNISLMKKETALVKGTVTTATGEKPEIAQVMFSTAGEMPFMGAFSTMVRDGSFEARVPPGHYRVMVMTTNTQSGPMTPSYNSYSIDVPPQGLQDLRFQGAGAQGKITARVSVEGAAQAVNLDNIRLQLNIKRDDEDGRNFFTMGDMGSGKADKDGVAVIEKLNPGTFEVNFFGGIPNQQDAYLKSVLQGSREVLVNGVRVSGDTAMQVILSVNGGRIEGTVTDANHNPVKGAYVVDVPPEEFRSRDQFYRVATTDQTGHFTLHSIRPGRHVVLALEDPEQGIWLDPEFLKQVESRGESYSIGEREAKQFQLQVVPKAQTAAGQ